MRKSIIERFGLILLIVGFACLGCDTAKKPVEEMQGKSVDENKERERLAAEKRAADQKAKAEADRKQAEEALAEAAKKVEAENDVPPEERLIEKDTHWPKQEAYERTQQFVLPLLKTHRKEGIWMPPNTFTWHQDRNTYTVQSTAHSLKAVDNDWTWKSEWSVVFISKGGVAHLEQIEIDGKKMYADGRFIGKAPPMGALNANPSSKAAKIEERKAAADAIRPKAAISLLNMAKQYQADGKDAKAKEMLLKIVDRYPETPAADDARELLGSAAPPKSTVAAGATDDLPDDPISDERTWTDKTGKHTVKAALVKHVDGTVILKTSAGKIVKLAVDKLSEDDQMFLKLNFGG